MRKYLTMIIGCLLFFSVSAQAGEILDSTKPLICASIEALDCAPGEPCDRGIPEFMDAPKFLRIDFAKKEVIGPLRTAQIKMIEKNEDQIVLQGYELNMGWTLALDRHTGNMTITFAGWDTAFIIFGACTTVP